MQLKKRLFLLSFTLAVVVVIFFGVYSTNKSSSKVTTVPPYVQGWNENTSKNVNDYINEDLKPLIFPRNFCDDDFDLLVMVTSKTSNFKARQTIRETWGQKGANFSIYFLLGEDKSQNYETKLKLVSESNKYNDIIQERFIDSYNNLTLKSVNMLKLFHLHCAKSYNFLMKIDDDVFFLVRNLLNNLGSLNSTNLLVGKLMNNTKPIRNPSSKWYVPYGLYSQEKYPNYLCGPAYLMSRDVAEKLYYCTLETPIFFIEDAYITGICAKKINVIPRHDPKFTCIPMKKYICPHRNLYTLHYFTPDEMLESYEILRDNTCPTFGSLWELILALLKR